MELLKVICLSVLAAVTFGILHDQVTARVCVEYFTIGHPPVFDTDSPTLLALGWGVIATWWVGLPLGILLGIASRAGKWPKRSARQLVRPIGVLLIVMAVFCLISGIAGCFAARAGMIRLNGRMAEFVPKEKHIPFIADACSHYAAYGVGFLGGLILAVVVFVGRVRVKGEGKS